MKRTGRLLEMMIALNTTQRFTVQELADRFEVSRRTMLRDLQLLSEMGVPLAATPGPHGGYSVIRSQQLPPVSLTAEEAISLIMSFETLEEYPDGPFQQENLSTLTKLRSVLPSDVLETANAVRALVATKVAKRRYKVPYIRDILRAAKERLHMEIDYESGSGRSRRVILPYGLIASNGFWYCPSFCYTRRERVWFRADRILGAWERPDFAGGAPWVELQEILRMENPRDEELLSLHATLTPRGCKLGDWHPLFGELIQRQPDGSGVIRVEITRSEVQIIGRYLLGLGVEVQVHEPGEVILFLKDEVDRIAKMYTH
ncbi:MAG: YafY family protein [Tumebacillaceae bacterium]